ncbi:MAG: hypothetical protein AAGF49_16680 [Pseudomonadota bacterium]
MRLPVIALVVLMCGPAVALEGTGNAVADGLLRAVEAAGYADARAQSVSREGPNTIVTAITAGEAGGKSIAIARALIEEGVVDADNRLAATTITYEHITLSDGRGGNSSANVVLRGPHLGASGENRAITALLGDFDALAVNALTARTASGQSVALEALTVTIAAQDRPGVAAGTLTMEGLVLGPDLMDAALAGRLRALGYDTLDLDFAASGAWEAATGAASLEGARLAMAGMGAVELEGAATGLTRETYRALSTTGVEFAALLEVMGNVSFNALMVAYEDDGLVPRLLDAGAAQAGIDREAFAARLVGLLPGALAGLGDGAFTQMVVDNVEGFLADPGRIAVRASPAAGVSALQVISAATLNPQLLPELLSITIEQR